MSALDAFAEHRPVLFAVAYRMLGSVSDAEDAVQDAWLRWSAADRDEVRQPRAYLIRTVSRLALDRMGTAARRREAYVGSWLPEPLVTEPDVAEAVAGADTVSTALLVVLETLTPLERAVFVLREAFDLPYAEIAQALGSTEPAVRQVAHRARAHVSAGRPRYAPDPRAHREVSERFLAACAGGDVVELLAVLAPEVTLVTDGGGIVRAPKRPLRGARTVAKFLVYLLRQGPDGTRIQPRTLNGRPGLVAYVGETPIGTITLDPDGDRIAAIYVTANPEKLAGVRA